MRVTGRATQRGAGKLIIILLVALIALLLAAGTAAALYFTGVVDLRGGDAADDGEAETAQAEDEPPAPARYLALGDPITVNIDGEGGRRAILQARLQIMARDEAVLGAVENHMPVIRNNLISLFGDQSLGTVGSSDGKAALRQESVEVINAVLAAEGAPGEVEAVYFTQLVTQ